MTRSIDGNGERLDPAGYDGSVWRWQLNQDRDPERRHSVLVRISGTAMSMGDEALPLRVALARETEGRSEVEQVLGWPTPPDEINVDSRRVTPFGGDPGPEERELLDIIEWFEERAMLLIFASRQRLSADGITVVSETHSAHVVARDEDRYLNHFEGLSRLDAARSAKAHWEVHAQQKVIEPAVETDEALPIKPVVTAEHSKRVETLRQQGYRLVWTEPTNPDDPIWALEVYNDGGELIVVGLGDNVEDALLGVAEELLPDM